MKLTIIGICFCGLLIAWLVAAAITGSVTDFRCQRLGYVGGSATLFFDRYCQGQLDPQQRERLRQWDQRTPFEEAKK